MSFWKCLEEAFEVAYGISLAYRIEEPYPLLPTEEVDV